MKLSFLSESTKKATDSFCLMKVNIDEKTLSYEYEGKPYYFCSENCKEQFKQDPEKYLL